MCSSKYYIKHINDPYLNRLLSPESNLFRPQLPWIKFSFGTLFLILLIFALVSISRYYSMHCNSPMADVQIFIFWTTLIFCSSVKYYLIFSVLCYQRYAKSSTRLKCCCYPSCSQYALIALKKYGCIIGSFLSLKHCIKCKPPGIHEFP